jgi:hypothetical protein
VLGDKAATNPFGQLWKSSWISGTVEAVVKSKKNIREQVSVDVLWEIRNNTQRKVVKVTNVCDGSWPPAAQEIGASMEDRSERDVDKIVGRAEQDGADSQEPGRTVSCQDLA